MTPSPQSSPSRERKRGIAIAQLAPKVSNSPWAASRIPEATGDECCQKQKIAQLSLSGSSCGRDDSLSPRAIGLSRTHENGLGKCPVVSHSVSFVSDGTGQMGQARCIGVSLRAATVALNEGLPFHAETGAKKTGWGTLKSIAALKSRIARAFGFVNGVNA